MAKIRSTVCVPAIGVILGVAAISVHCAPRAYSASMVPPAPVPKNCTNPSTARHVKLAVKPRKIAMRSGSPLAVQPLFVNHGQRSFTFFQNLPPGVLFVVSAWHLVTGVEAPGTRFGSSLPSWQGRIISPLVRPGESTRYRRPFNLARYVDLTLPGKYRVVLTAGRAVAASPALTPDSAEGAAISKPAAGILPQYYGRFTKTFHMASLRLSPARTGECVVATVANRGTRTLRVSAHFSAWQLTVAAISGPPPRRTAAAHGMPLAPMRRVTPGGDTRFTFDIAKYFRLPRSGTFRIQLCCAVAARTAGKGPQAGAPVYLRSNRLTLTIGPGGKLAWSVPGGGAVPKAVKISPVPRPPARAILPATGPVATLSALADAVSTANVTKARALVDRTPAAKLILAEIPLAGQIDLFCRAVRQHLAFDPAPRLEKVYPSVGSLDRILTRLDLKSLRINGDQASVAVWGLNRARTKWVAGLTLLLRRVHGKWLYSGAAGFRLTRQQLAREGEFDRRLAKIFGGLTVQINNGKIKTITQLDRVSTAELRRADAWYARPAGATKAVKNNK